MSNTLNSTNPIQKPQDTKEQKSDLTLVEKENNSDYNRRNIFKWFLLCLFILVISCVALCFLYKFFTVSTVQRYILNQIMDNFIFILLSGLAILKINIPANKWS